MTMTAEDAIGLADALPLLAWVEPETRRLVEASFERLWFSFGDEIVREGDAADALYVVRAGTARALTTAEDGREVSLAHMRPGESFGELGLVEGGKRTATVRAGGDVEVMRLHGSVVRALAESRPDVRQALERSARRRELNGFLRSSPAFDRLPLPVLGDLLDALDPVAVPAGEAVVRVGEVGDSFYVVRSGRLRAFAAAPAACETYLRAGDVFGEMALLTGEPRSRTVEAVTGCELLRMGASAFADLRRRHPEFDAAVADRAALHDARTSARLPLDFADDILAATPAPTPPPTAKAAAPEEAAEADDLPDAARPRIRRLPFVWQIDGADCGAACLAMCCRHFGREVALSYVREAAHTGRDGTTMLGMTSGAEALGLAARGLKVSEANLDRLPLPAILHWENNHWIVLYRLDRGHAWVADPRRGRRRISRDKLLAGWSRYAVVLEATPALEQAPREERTLAWLRPLLRPHRSAVALAFVLALVASGLQMLLPLFSGVVVDKVVVGGRQGLLGPLALAMAGLLALSVLAGGVQRWVVSSRGVKLDTAALDFVSARLLRLPSRWFAVRRSGDIERRLSGLRQARQFAIQNGIQALTAVAQLMAVIGLMMVTSWRLGLAYLALLPLYAGMMRFAVVRLRPMYDAIEEGFGRYQARQIDAIKGIETVKAAAAEDAVQSLMLRRFTDLAGRVFRADLVMALYQGITMFLTFAGFAVFLWASAIEVTHGRLSVGGLVTFTSLVLLGNAPIVVILAVWDQLQMVNALVNRLNDVVQSEVEQPDARKAVPTLAGRVEVAGLGFHYGGPGAAPILSDVGFRAEPGMRVAIIGRSGSGKTTLVRCLAGLVEPTAGSIRYDGVDLADLDRRQLRRQFGLVLQENHLFEDSIAHNIALGDEEPDMDAVIRAAKLADAHGFIERLPLGYETVVGESGLLLSGGQRQRVAIARALYRDPPVLILDEATSSLDSESERTVQDNLAPLLRERTCFVIAHRLSTVRDADLILVVERGRIAERGTHDELMDRRGIYFYLVSQQLGL